MKILTIFEDGRIGGPHNQFLYFYKKNNKLNQHNHLLIMPNFNKSKIFDKKINFIKLNLTYLSKSNLFFYLSLPVSSFSYLMLGFLFRYVLKRHFKISR